MKPEKLFKIYNTLDKTEKKQFLEMLFDQGNSNLIINAYNSGHKRSVMPDYIEINEIKAFLEDE